MKLLYLALVDGTYPQLFNKIEQQLRCLRALVPETSCAVIGVNGGRVDTDKFSFRYVDLAAIPGSADLRSACFKAAAYLTEEFGPDIVYFRYPFFDEHALSFVQRYRNVVFEIQSIAANEVSPQLAEVELSFGPQVLAHSRGIVAVTSELLAYERGRCPTPLAGCVVPNGIDTASLPFASSNYDEGEVHILCAAHFSRWHGMDRLLRGLSDYSGTTPVVVHMAGDGEELPAYRDLVETSGLSERVFFHGKLDTPALNALASRCQVGIGSLGLHRLGLREFCILKNREYCLRGLPFVYAGHDVDFPTPLPFTRVLPADESPVDINVITDLAACIAQNPEIRKIERDYALRFLSWEHKIENLVDFLSSINPNRSSTHDAKQLPGENAPGRQHILIACTHFWPSIGGVETIAENLGANFIERGYQVDVATWAFTGRESDSHKGIRIFSLEATRERNGAPEWVHELRALVTSGEYDACILLADPQNLVIWSLEYAVIPPQTRIIIQPLINEEGYGNWKTNRDFRHRLADILKKADAVIALSRSGAEQRYFGDEGINAIYLPNATSREQHADDFRIRFGIPSETPLFVHVANLWPVKNHDGLLRTLREMPGDWRLAMIGHPTDDWEYVELVRREASVDSRVILIPGLSRKDVASAMAAADIFLLSSHGEVSPVTILEAMSHGIPWLATPECGSIGDFAGGVITPLGEFPATLQLLLAHNDIRLSLGKAGQRHWQSCFTWDAAIPAWIQLVQTGSTSCCFAMPDDVSVAMESIVNDISLFSQGRTTPPPPMVSVIVPTYNRPELLAKALSSIREQTFQNYEIIVVNDAGVDVARLVDHFNKRGTIRYINKKTNQGLAAARNTAIMAARGKYIAYLDDDDVFFPDHLETLVNYLEDNTCQVAYSDACRAIQDKIGDAYITTHRDTPYNVDFDPDRLLVENFIPVLCVMHERLCLDQVGLFDESLPRHEDWDLLIRLSQLGPFGHIRKITAEFTHRTTDIYAMTSGTLPSMLSTLEKIYNKSASFTAGKPEVIARRKSYLFDLKNRIHGFLRDRIDILPVNLEKNMVLQENGILDRLRKTGATKSQILAAFYHTLGLRHSAGNAVTALSFFSRALEADPVCSPVHQSIAEALMRIGEFDKAVRHCEVILSQEPNDPELVDAVAAMTRKLGKLRQAEIWEEKASQLRSDMNAD